MCSARRSAAISLRRSEANAVLKLPSPVILLLLLLCTQTAFAQTSRLNDHCDLGVLGEAETKDFLAFDTELRAALSRPDAALLTLLVNYPLRVNGDRGSWYINDPASLQSRFQEIFPPSVRADVLGSAPESLHCSYRGVMYGSGTVWINSWQLQEAGNPPRSAGFLVQAINLPGKRGAGSKDSVGRVEFAGRASRYRLVIDLVPGGPRRLRLWNAGQSLLTKPAWEIREGIKTVDGTGPCAHAIWKFKIGPSNFEVQELGCYADSNQPPKGTKGRLEIAGSKDAGGLWWLY